jgi:hypothetical protein
MIDFIRDATTAGTTDVPIAAATDEIIVVTTAADETMTGTMIGKEIIAGMIIAEMIKEIGMIDP